MQERIRALNKAIVEYYDVPLTILSKISKKSYQAKDNEGKEFFLKIAPYNSLEKYQFLSGLGIDNVLYPEMNSQNQFVTRSNNYSFYITPYFNDNSVLDEMKAENLLRELNNLHKQTVIKRQLSVRLARPKFEEITSQLDARFKVIENYVRSLESKPLQEFSMAILGNYQHILDAKKELIRLQMRIISSIKGREKIDYVFVHNRPSMDHLLNVRGVNYLTSLENGKIGISSLDLAKYYIENEDLNVNFHELIVNGYFNGENNFYYDYFRFLVLFINIKKLVVSSDYYATAQSFSNVSKSIQKYFDNFLDNKEDISDENDSFNN